mmetsp:Transcript_110457/g.311551  ORF Transcript_110457/g.311551 Transcript_110457/m.311551 type:complete len:156 (+) Transcript_110457:135-602(+)
MVASVATSDDSVRAPVVDRRKAVLFHWCRKIAIKAVVAAFLSMCLCSQAKSGRPRLLRSEPISKRGAATLSPGAPLPKKPLMRREREPHPPAAATATAEASTDRPTLRKEASPRRFAVMGSVFACVALVGFAVHMKGIMSTLVRMYAPGEEGKVK